MDGGWTDGIIFRLYMSKRANVVDQVLFRTALFVIFLPSNPTTVAAFCSNDIIFKIQRMFKINLKMYLTIRIDLDKNMISIQQ